MKSCAALTTALLLPVLTIAAEPTISVKGVAATREGTNTLCSIIIETSTGYMADMGMYDSGITRFVDDRGTDLGTKSVEKMPDYFNGPCYQALSYPGEVEKKVLATVMTPRKSHPNATKVFLEGELRIKYCDKKDENQTALLQIKDGTQVAIGDQRGTVEGVTNRNGKTEFTIKMITPPRAFEVDDIDLYDAKGAKIRASCNKIGSSFGGGPVSYEIFFYGIEVPVDAVIFKYVAWQNLQNISVPYSIIAPFDTTLGSPAVPAAESRPDKVVNAKQSGSALPPAVQATPGAEAPVQQQAQVSTAAEWPRLKVSGIMGKQGNRSAIINGEIVAIGGDISGVKVISITADKVTLRFGEKTVSLRAGDSYPR